MLLVPLQKNQEVLHTKSKSKVMSQFFNDHEIQVHIRVLLLPFIVLLQNKHAKLAENCENLILNAQPRISAHSQCSKIY